MKINFHILSIGLALLIYHAVFLTKKQSIPCSVTIKLSCNIHYGCFSTSASAKRLLNVIIYFTFMPSILKRKQGEQANNRAFYKVLFRLQTSIQCSNQKSSSRRKKIVVRAIRFASPLLTLLSHFDINIPSNPKMFPLLMTIIKNLRWTYFAASSMSWFWAWTNW